jgi:hypothetical protein
MSIANLVSFDIKCKGDETEKDYEGLFKAKTKVSIKDRLKEDEFRRSILGVDSQNAGVEASMIASAVAYLAVRLVEFPDWWKASEGGLKLEDSNVLAEVNNKAMAEVAKEYQKLAKKAEEAQVEIKAELAKSQ